MDDDPRTEILEATYRALCRRGYANLTVADIAAEADKSKGLIYYHFDSKENLFSEFSAFLFEGYAADIESIEGRTPREELFRLLRTVLPGEESNDGEPTDAGELRTAFLEANARAPYDDSVRTRLAEFEALLAERLRGLVSAGIDAGEFDEAVDPAAASELLVTTIAGAHARQVSVDYSPERLSETMTRYADGRLLADETAEVVS